MAKSFFSEVGVGFFKAGAEKYERQSKLEDEMDAYARKRVLDADYEQTLYDYKKKKDAEARTELLKQYGYKATNSAIEQTPDAVSFTKTSLNPNGVNISNTEVDDTDYPEAGTMAPTKPAPPTSKFGDWKPTPDVIVRAQQAFNAELIAGGDNPNPDKAELARDKVLQEAFENSEQYKLSAARASEQGKLEAQKAQADAIIAPRKQKLEANPDLPNPGSVYFDDPELRAEARKVDVKRMSDWEAGQSKEGEAYLHARSSQGALLQNLELQPDVATGGIIWGNSALNYVRTKFDSKAAVFDANSAQQSINKAKEVLPVSNTDMAFLNKMASSLDKPGQANKALLQAQLLANQMLMERKAFADAYFKEWGTLQGFDAAYAKYAEANPLVDTKASKGLDIVANDNRQSIEDFLTGKPKAEKAATVDNTTSTESSLPTSNIGKEKGFWK